MYYKGLIDIFLFFFVIGIYNFSGAYVKLVLKYYMRVHNLTKISRNNAHMDSLESLYKVPSSIAIVILALNLALYKV